MTEQEHEEAAYCIELEAAREALESPASSAGPLPIPEPTKLQANKARYLIDKGGMLAQPRLEVVMPDGPVARIDSGGRVYWQ